MIHSEKIKERRFLNSLKNDDMVMRSLPLELFRTGGDKFNNEKHYIPTAFVQLSSKMWVPLEIKCSKKFNTKMEYLDLKNNQVFRMAKLNGSFLFSSESHYAIIEAAFAIKMGEEVYSEQMEKNCYRILSKDIQWVEYPQKLIFV